MRWVLAVALLLSTSAAAAAEESLPSRNLLFTPIVVPDVEPMNFDLVDFRAEQRLRAAHARRTDAEPHSIFVIKRHIGVAAGQDSGIVHGSLGLYLTIAEWGRWNFGVPAAELGFGRYLVYDPKLRQTVVKNEYTLIVSLASVHYRLTYLRAVGANAYINFEQVYDLRHNLPGSQVGISFSGK
jgi:hypothetical protein